MKVIEKPVEIEQGDSFKVLLSKYGALALDKQENLSELIGETDCRIRQAGLKAMVLGMGQ